MGGRSFLRDLAHANEKYLLENNGKMLTGKNRKGNWNQQKKDSYNPGG